MFQAHVILIVEDEFLIAMELADAVEAMNGTVLGPMATVQEALELLDSRAIDGAILDAKLQDGDVTPVALRLAREAIPLVVHSGTGLPAEVARHWPDLPVLMKPTAATTVAASFVRVQETRPHSPGVNRPSPRGRGIGNPVPPANSAYGPRSVRTP